MKINTTYIVNEAKRTVVCKMEVINELSDKTRRYDLISDFDDFLYEKYKKNYRLCIDDTIDCIGIAKCAPEDKWDETIGKRVAECKAYRQRQNIVNRIIKEFIRWKSDEIEKIDKKMDNLYKYGLLKDSNSEYANYGKTGEKEDVENR